MQQQFDTIIIGAGFAGVAAAVDLVRAGKRVALVEARTEPGGRARSVESGFGKTDNGQHLLMGCYSNTFATLSALGAMHHIWRSSAIPMQFFVGKQHHVVVPGSNVWPSKTRFAVGLLKSPMLSPSEKFALARLFASLLVSQSPAGLTVAKWLEQCKQPQSLVQKFWEPLCLATINADIGVADAALLWRVLKLAFLGPKGASDFAFATCALSDLLLPVESFLRSQGSEFLQQINVKAITSSDGTFSISSKQQQALEAQSVIVATSPSVATKLVSTLDVSSIPKFAYSPIASLYVKLGTPIQLPIMSAGIGTTAQWVFNTKAIHNRTMTAETQELTVTVSAAKAAILSRDAFVDTVLAELAQMFTHFRKHQVVDTHLIVEKRATPVFSPDVTAIRPSNNTSVNGLYLAGDYTQTHLPATIESASLSGRQAASLILRYLDVHSR